MSKFQGDPEPGDGRTGEDHEPVLRKEVIHYLDPRPGDTIVDCTLGHAGHSIDILLQLRGEGRLIGIDVSSKSLLAARRRIETACQNPSSIGFVEGNFADLALHLSHVQSPPAGGILLDLGPSTPQLRFMGWNSDEPLDMRLSDSVGDVTAGTIVNEWDERDLTRILRDNADEKFARRIARRLVERRAAGPVRTGRELGQVVSDAIPRKAWPPRMHPATRTFMALRMEVNRELDNLRAVLPQAYEALRPGGRLVVISFHGGEDLIVKRFMQEMSRPPEPPWPLPQKDFEGSPRMKLLTRRPVTPTEEEIRMNPPSRAARLRAAEKIS